MKKSITLIAFLILAVCTSFAASVKKNYSVGDFSDVQMYGMAKLVVSKGTTVNVRVEGDEELVNLYEVRVEGKKLVIKPKNKNGKQNTWGINKKIQFFVELPQLNNLSLLGSGDVIIKDKVQWGMKSSVQLSGSGDITVGKLNVSDFGLTLIGSGDIEVNSITANTFNTEIRGSGDVKVKNLSATKVNAQLKGSGDITLSKGKISQADYKIAGSGDIEAGGIITENVTAFIAGSGDISCYASQSISGNVTGSGIVSYKGKPSRVDISKKGFRAM